MWKAIIAVFLAVGLIAVAYFLGRTGGSNLAELNRKIDSLSANIAEQQREIDGQVAGFAKLLEQFGGVVTELGTRQAAISEGLGRMAGRLSELDANIRVALDKLADVNGIVGSNDDALRELFDNIQRLQALIGPENTRH